MKLTRSAVGGYSRVMRVRQAVAFRLLRALRSITLHPRLTSENSHLCCDRGTLLSPFARVRKVTFSRHDSDTMQNARE